MASNLVASYWGWPRSFTCFAGLTEQKCHTDSPGPVRHMFACSLLPLLRVLLDRGQGRLHQVEYASCCRAWGFTDGCYSQFVLCQVPGSQEEPEHDLCSFARRR